MSRRVSSDFDFDFGARRGAIKAASQADPSVLGVAEAGAQVRQVRRQHGHLDTGAEPATQRLLPEERREATARLGRSRTVVLRGRAQRPLRPLPP